MAAPICFAPRADLPRPETPPGQTPRPSEDRWDAWAAVRPWTSRFLLGTLDLAAALGLPVLLHCRKAYDALYACLLPYRGRLQGILHSYSGGKGQMPRFLELGFYIAFSGSVTRPNARRHAETAAAVPPDRFLLETDAPSIATATRKASEVEPCHIVEIANKVAELRRLSLAGVCEQSWENGGFRWPA